jgi:glycosyltransferase involved in cell wall biosynthesis
LAVVGNTEHSPYPSLARDLAVSDRVHFLGFRRDVPHLMRAATFCVCPSRYEPFSLVVLEALASGLPVVTARSVGAASLVASDCGFVLDDPEDTEGLIRVFQYLLDHPDERRQMGQAGRAVAERNTFHAMGHAYVDLFEEYRSRTASGTPESPHPLAAERVGDEPPHGVRSSTTRTKKPQADG